MWKCPYSNRKNGSLNAREGSRRSQTRGTEGKPAADLRAGDCGQGQSPEQMEGREDVHARVGKATELAVF